MLDGGLWHGAGSDMRQELNKENRMVIILIDGQFIYDAKVWCTILIIS